MIPRSSYRYILGLVSILVGTTLIVSCNSPAPTPLNTPTLIPTAEKVSIAPQTETPTETSIPNSLPSTIPTEGPTLPAPTNTTTPTPEKLIAGWNLVWRDEFDEPNLDLTKWTWDTGGNGWGNGELEYYTNRPDNARVENGMLVIEARKEDYKGLQYTSARLKTQGLVTWTYGRVEARIRVPAGQGLWPAFWMLGDDISTSGWPKCGEIDIMENLGREPGRIHGTIHGQGYSGGAGITAAYNLPSGKFSDDFHVFAIEWEPGVVRWYVDDVLYHTVAMNQVPGKWVFDHPFFILLNVAVGGGWPGSPTSATTFPQTMQVDYVRVFEKAK